MKVVLFCGGQGTRLREYSDRIPKPLVPVGDVPILLHIMAYYAAFGHKDFVLCLGHKGELIRRYFLEAHGARPGPDDTATLGAWRIAFAETGEHTTIGGRLLRVRRHLEGEEMFLANYADVLTNLDLKAMVSRFRASGAVGGFCAVTPPYSFHLVRMDEAGRVERLTTLREAGALMNGGYMVLRQAIFENLFDGEELVVEGFERLAADDSLFAFRHEGFWMPMDTFKEQQALDAMAARGETPWRVWKRPTGDARLQVA